jgi:hypothetical protein
LFQPELVGIIVKKKHAMMLAVEIGPAALGYMVEDGFFVRLEAAQVLLLEPQTQFVIGENIGPNDFGMINPVFIRMSPENSEPAVLVPS